MECGMGTALGTAHLIAAFEEEQKVNEICISVFALFEIDIFSCFLNSDFLSFFADCGVCSLERISPPGNVHRRCTGGWSSASESAQSSSLFIMQIF